MGTLISLIEMIEAAYDERMMKNVIRNFGSACGFDRFAYLQAVGADVRTFNNYPAEWEDIYIKKHYSRIDPVVTEAGRRAGPFSWTADNWQARGTSEARRFRDEAIDHGIRSGVTIPVGGTYGARMMLTFASSRSDADVTMLPTPQNAMQVIMAIHYQLRILAASMVASPKKHLSAREMICLTWAAKGKKGYEIARLTGINPRTVQHYLDSAREKLGAATLSQLVAIAKDLALI
jgi:LuxR family transcriptional activator of conjugal transfer of Ti plasmids